MKKNDIAVIVAAVCLVGASLGSAYVAEGKTSMAESAVVTSVTDPYEFVAVTKSTYADGKVNVKVETTAPNGSVMDVYLENNEIGSLTDTVVINRGVGEVVFEVPTDLEVGFLLATAQLDISKQPDQINSLAVKRYGQFGEKMIGDNVGMFSGTTQLSGISSTEMIAYPSEEAVKPMLEEMFYMHLEAIKYEYGAFFAEILPADDGNWEEFNLVCTEFATTEAWDLFDKKTRQDFFEYFELLVHTYKMVDEETPVNVVFKDMQGNVLDSSIK